MCPEGLLQSHPRAFPRPQHWWQFHKRRQKRQRGLENMSLLLMSPWCSSIGVSNLPAGILYDHAQIRKYYLEILNSDFFGLIWRPRAPDQVGLGLWSLDDTCPRGIAMCMSKESFVSPLVWAHGLASRRVPPRSSSDFAYQNCFPDNVLPTFATKRGTWDRVRAHHIVNF